MCVTGDQVLEQLSFQDVQIWFVIMMNLVIGGAFHVLAFLLLKVSRPTTPCTRSLLLLLDIIESGRIEPAATSN